MIKFLILNVVIYFIKIVLKYGYQKIIHVLNVEKLLSKIYYKIMVKRSSKRNQRVGKKRSSVKKSKNKNYSRKRFYKRSKRLMRGG